VSSSVAAEPSDTSRTSSASDPADVTPEPHEATNDEEDDVAAKPTRQQRTKTRKARAGDGDEPDVPGAPRHRQPAGTPGFRPVGDAHYPLTKWSLTVSRTKQDVPGYLLEVFFTWMEQFCVRGLISTEVGHRAFHLHLQGIFECRYPATDKAVNEVR
jgi:hypothetical protein